MPIDPDFNKKRRIVENHRGHAVWGPIEPPTRLGIHGTSVAVDWDICEGCGTCIDVCPVNVYEWAETPDHPVSERKSDPVRESECIQCLACETQCPTQAIKITPP
ncbi:MAG: ferredoxin family protein [Candidatus Bathyarchaeia archaeon]